MRRRRNCYLRYRHTSSSQVESMAPGGSNRSDHEVKTKEDLAQIPWMAALLRNGPPRIIPHPSRLRLHALPQAGIVDGRGRKPSNPSVIVGRFTFVHLRPTLHIDGNLSSKSNTVCKLSSCSFPLLVSIRRKPL